MREAEDSLGAAVERSVFILSLMLAGPPSLAVGIVLGLLFFLATGIYFLVTASYTVASSVGSALKGISEPQVQVAHVPGFGLLRVATLFSKRTRENVLEPTIRDFQDEFLEALADYDATSDPSDLRRAQFVRVRGYLSFVAVIAALIPSSILRLAKQFYRLSS